MLSLIIMLESRVRKAKEEIPGTITIDMLTKAVLNSPKLHKGDPKKIEEARRTAEHTMSFFGFDDRISDNLLEPDDRDAFYMLEDAGLITTDQELAKIAKGKEWRVHYWTFKKKEIYRLANLKKKEKVEDPAAIYSKIDDEVWDRNGND